MQVSAGTVRELAGTHLAEAPRSGRMSKDPDQLKLFFDQPPDYYRSFRRSAASAGSRRSSGGGWDVDERFNVTHTPNLATMSRPVITVGARVTELEDRAQPLFGAEVPVPRMNFSSTLEQQDIGMAGDPHAQLPACASAREGSARLVMKEPEGFVNMVMRGPKFELEAEPAIQRSVLTAAEQRRIMEHIRDRDRAHQVTRKALSSKARMTQTIKQNYRRGILQVDTPATEGSELYTSARDRVLAQEYSRRSHSQERRWKLEQEQNRHGRQILHHSEEPVANPHRPLRRNMPQPNTYNRVFGGDSDAPPPGNPFDPDANSRYQYTGDRAHDIISGKVLPFARSKPQYAQFPDTLYM